MGQVEGSIRAEAARFVQCFDTVPSCDGRTDEKTHNNNKYRASIASCCKKNLETWLMNSSALKFGDRGLELTILDIIK